MATATTSADRGRGDHHGGLDAQALPDDGDVARAVGEPDHAGGEQRDQGEVEKDADHAGSPFARAF